MYGLEKIEGYVRALINHFYYMVIFGGGLYVDFNINQHNMCCFQQPIESYRYMLAKH